MKYLTQLLNKRVVSPSGETVGKIVDAIAALEERFPAVKAILVRTDSGELCIPYDAVEFDDDPDGPNGPGDIIGDIRLRMPLEAITPYTPQAEDLRLRRDVLDKQIVDVQGHRVVRVNDVRLAECGGRYCVVGIDAGLRAMLRQLGALGKPIEATARLLRRPLRSNLIAWDDVQTLEPSTAGGSIRLKVSHDKIARLHPADIADIVEQLSPQQRAEVIEALDTETAADAIAEVEPEVQVEIMQHLDNETATDILEEMEPDEAADVRELMVYDDETAGGLMTTELVAIQAHLTCEETINRLRELAPKAETIYYVYVVDDDDRLMGVLSLRDLVIAPPETSVVDIMVRNVIHVYEDDHADQVAQIIGRYNLLAVPVLSKDERLLGIITVDDTIERLLPPERHRRLPVLTLTDKDET